MLINGVTLGVSLLMAVFVPGGAEKVYAGEDNVIATSERVVQQRVVPPVV
jgi:hypothetical protein